MKLRVRPQPGHFTPSARFDMHASGSGCDANPGTTTRPSPRTWRIADNTSAAAHAPSMFQWTARRAGRGGGSAASGIGVSALVVVISRVLAGRPLEKDRFDHGPHPAEDRV